MQKEKAPLGLYIHIPFCRQKCAYCDFYSLPRSEEKMDAYTAALLRHIEEVAPRTAAHRVDTVYFGGGTPSYLGPDRLTKLLRTLRKRCPVARDAEITLEANPDSACDVKALRALRRAGFNRISLGVQSADDGLLRAIGRIHTFAQVQEAVAAVRKAARWVHMSPAKYSKMPPTANAKASQPYRVMPCAWVQSGATAIRSRATSQIQM